MRDGASQYADSLAELSASGTDLVDDVLGTSAKQGFEYRISAHPDGYSWDATAWPASGTAGNRRFYTNQSGVIYFSSQDVRTPAPLTAGRGDPPAGFNALGG